MSLPVINVGGAPKLIRAIFIVQGVLNSRFCQRIHGNGSIADTVALNGDPEIPARRRVTLFDRANMQAVASVWSDPTTGAYSFDKLRADIPYMVVADDYTAVHNAAVADWQYPT